MIKWSFVFVLTVSSAWGLVKADINSTQKLKATFSLQDTNRITVENGRIAQVFGVDDLFAIQFDEENGQCFVKAKSNPGHAVTITVITEDNETQDIEATFTEKSSETVILHSPKGDFNVTVDSFEPKEDLGVEIIKKLVRNEIPKGFAVMKLSEAYQNQIRGLEAIVLQRLTGSGVEVLVGTLKNPLDDTVTLNESKLASIEDLAVYVGQSELKSGSSTGFIVVRKKGAK
jgi:hypothetical protein